MDRFGLIETALRSIEQPQYLAEFKAQELDDETLELCFLPGGDLSDARDIFSVRGHWIKFRSAFQKQLMTTGNTDADGGSANVPVAVAATTVQEPSVSTSDFGWQRTLTTEALQAKDPVDPVELSFGQFESAPLQSSCPKVTQQGESFGASQGSLLSPMDWSTASTALQPV